MYEQRNFKGLQDAKGGGISLHLRDSIDNDNAFLFHVFQAFMPFTPVSDLHPSKLKRDTTDDLTLLSGSCLIIQSSNAAISIPRHILKRKVVAFQSWKYLKRKPTARASQRVQVSDKDLQAHSNGLFCVHAFTWQLAPAMSRVTTSLHKR
jgi:hypothetical protein